MHSVTFLYAFLAGLLSFLSPCVLPLVPGYISMLSGTAKKTAKPGLAPLAATAAAEPGGSVAVAAPPVRRVWHSSALLRNAVFFVIGFSVVFVSLGAAATSVGQVLRTYRVLLGEISGIIVILFGLHLLGLIKINALYADKRLRAKTAGSAVGAFAIGFAFAFGWTPCIGPILGTILLLAAGQNTVGLGISLLVVYSLGLAVPFLLTALALDRFASFYQGFRRHLHAVEVVSGVLLIVIGVLLLTNRFTVLSGYLAKVPILNKLVL